MATTTNYSWTTPDDTALVKDGAAAIRTLGSAIDTTTKNLNPSTTLGDIEYRSSTANTNTRLPIGTTGQVLTVSGGVPTWAASVAGADAVLTPEISTYYIRPYFTSASSMTPTSNTTYYVPIFLPTCSFDRIAFSTAATMTTAGNTRLGLYNASATTGLPTTVAFDAGVVNATVAGTIYTITISQSISAGWYYLAFNRQSGSYNVTSSNTNNINPSFGNIRTDITGTAGIGYFTQASVTGAFATAGTLTGIDSGNAFPMVGLRIV